MSDHLPAFRELNLPRNPFGELTPDEWAAVAVVDVDPLVDWLSEDGRCVQLVGACGRGKTTHLHALRRALPHAVMRRAGRQPPGPGDLLLLDEYDIVGPLARWRHLRRASRCAVAAHADFSRQLGWMGWQVHTVHVAVRDRATIARIAEHRVRQLAPGPLPAAPPVDLDAVVDRTGDDLRALTDALYDAWQHPLEASRVQV